MCAYLCARVCVCLYVCLCVRVLYSWGRGMWVGRFFEIANKAIHLLGSAAGSEQVKGACLVPKRGLAVMECEVDRLMRLTEYVNASLSCAPTAILWPSTAFSTVLETTRLTHAFRRPVPLVDACVVVAGGACCRCDLRFRARTSPASTKSQTCFQTLQGVFLAAALQIGSLAPTPPLERCRSILGDAALRA